MYSNDFQACCTCLSQSQFARYLPRNSVASPFPVLCHQGFEQRQKREKKCAAAIPCSVAAFVSHIQYILCIYYVYIYIHVSIHFQYIFSCTHLTYLSFYCWYYSCFGFSCWVRIASCFPKSRLLGKLTEIPPNLGWLLQLIHVDPVKW